MTTEADKIIESLLERYGTPFSAELGLDLQKNTPSVLFRWLCAALLMSARISRDKAMAAAQALSDAGWTTAAKMAESNKEERVKVLNRAAANSDAGQQRERLKAFKGIGDVGADIFFREHYPLLDDKACTAAQRFGLPDAAADLADHVSRTRFAQLATALVRAELEDTTQEQILQETEKAAT